jgi:hypothetical protein
MQKERLYHVILKRITQGSATYPIRHTILMTGYPMSHKQCMTYISKFTPHKHAILTIRERILP